jgi:hypothetical protein
MRVDVCVCMGVWVCVGVGVGVGVWVCAYVCMALLLRPSRGEDKRMAHALT